MSAPENNDTNDNLDDFDKQMEADFAKANLSSGAYADTIEQLTNLAGQAKTAGSIATTDADTYAKLLEVVRVAAASNLSQAELKQRIVGLGDAAVRIAKRVQSIASIF